MKPVKIVYMPEAPNVRIVETTDTIYINSATKQDPVQKMME